MHYPEYDNIDRERAFFENKDTNGNNVDDFAQLDINGLDEVTGDMYVSDIISAQVLFFFIFSQNLKI